jgi:diguanylate cyclase (GGDEF)-like protein
MSAPIEPFESYGALLQRLLPPISHALIARANGSVLWASDQQAESALQSTRIVLAGCAALPPSAIDGMTGEAGSDGATANFGFCVRGAHGEPLAFVLIAVRNEQGSALDLAAIHAQIKPALDCLQSELSARTLFIGADSLGEIPAVAMQALAGVVGAVLLPDCNLSLSRSGKGQPRSAEPELLAQLHELLLTRAQVHRRTLIANRLHSGSGRARLPYKAISAPIFDESRRVIGVLAVFRDEPAADFQPGDTPTLEMLARKAGHIACASFDLSTGFLTEAAFLAQGQARLAAQPASAGSSGLLYFDIDQLHVVNETHGMPVGDEVVDGIAQLLRMRARDSTLLARIAGDRFAMFVPGCSIEPVARIAEEIRACAVRLSGPRADRPVRVSLSVGVARIAESDRDFRQALAAAELACQTAKDRGRNRVEVFYGSRESDQKIRSARRAAAHLAASNVRESLELLAQPVLPLGALQSTPRFEIFMRMRAADGTRLNFDKLISADGGAELPCTVDRWVIEQTIERLSGQRELLREYPAQFSLNLSAESLRTEEFWAMLEGLVRGADLPPGTIACEFSAEAAQSQLEVLPRHMEKLRALGVNFAIDNVGRGIGCLSNLGTLPLSCIKIDGSLSRDLDYNPRSQAMVLAITKLAHGFGLETIASQVETDAIRARAAQLDVDFGQGFFIGRLLDLGEAIRDLPLYSCFDTLTACAG